MKKKTGVSKIEVPRGMPKSGRVWKEPKERASSMRKGKRDTFQKKQLLREELKRVKELSQVVRDAKQAEMDDKRKRTALNKLKKEENAKKSEVVQVIKNPAKLKRMKKKQLKKIEKRNTTVVEAKAKPTKPIPRPETDSP